MNNWQPIETAPKDGSYFMAIICGFHPKTKAPYLPAIVSWDEENNLFSEADDEKYDMSEKWSDNLTHWMPLPESPAVTAGKGGDDAAR